MFTFATNARRDATLLSPFTVSQIRNRILSYHIVSINEFLIRGITAEISGCLTF